MIQHRDPHYLQQERQKTHSFFYVGSRLTTVTAIESGITVFQTSTTPLAQITRSQAFNVTLLACDFQKTIVQEQPNKGEFKNYTPYGFSQAAHRGAGGILAFNGEHLNARTAAYLLGNYRFYSPSSMRFNSPDNMSPFGTGGVNSYAYCGGQPITRKDDSGQFWRDSIARIKHTLGLERRQTTSTFSIHDMGGTRVNSADLGRYKTLENILEAKLPDELASFNKKRDNGWLSTFSIENRKSAEGLKKIKWPDRFVFTDPPELIVATGHHQMAAMTHAALATRGNNTRVISAGMIRSLGGMELEISNKSGHYRTSFDRLIPVENYLSELGFHVRKVRAF
ncbi:MULTISPECIES: RHS repeat-associated core domain-containing protein [unclassified Pseudomonas]|uniref:RHS repeat-associated core domain-containing protein n=1 Tax=unclassified Pseudomonas TaxID=196821 RepID=UPI00257F329C|nr:MULTISPECIES: RHS repeat-associated core domain-containing protein [unclassified Pseudomonas]